MVFSTIVNTLLGLFAAVQQPPLTPMPLPIEAPINYPTDYCENINNIADSFDIIVVGAGAAGSTIARRLSEVPYLKILLIEAGGDPTAESDIPGNVSLLNGDLRWNFTAIKTPKTCRGVKGGKCAYALGHVLGGCSTVNYMMYTRGNKEDYNEWAAMGNDGWDYESVLPYFKKLENYVAQPITKKATPKSVSSRYHAKGGPMTTASFPLDPMTHTFRQAAFKATADIGIPFNPDINGENQIGFTNLPGTVNQIGYRENVAKAYLVDIPDNLKVCKHSTVTKIILKDKTATGVEFTRGSNTVQVSATKQVIISAGALNSSPILERSGIGRPDVLSKASVKVIHELSGVGEQLQEQYNNGGSAFEVDFGTQSAANPLSIGLTSLTGFWNVTDPSSSTPNVQFILSIYTPEVGKMVKQELMEQYQRPKKSILYFGTIVLRQSIKGSVHITQSSDPTITPHIDTKQLVGESDVELTVKATQLVRKIMSHEALKQFKPVPFILDECKAFPFNSEDEIMCGARNVALPLYHFAGPTMMGPKSNPNAVVDPRLRVHGLKNLRVVDSGVMPLVTRANTVIPTVMIAEKAADLVKEDLGLRFK